MAETVVVYCGVQKVGKLKRQAIRKEAFRKGMSISEVVWECLRKFGSPELRKELEDAEGARI